MPGTLCLLILPESLLAVTSVATHGVFCGARRGGVLPLLLLHSLSPGGRRLLLESLRRLRLGRALFAKFVGGEALWSALTFLTLRFYTSGMFSGRPLLRTPPLVAFLRPLPVVGYARAVVTAFAHVFSPLTLAGLSCLVGAMILAPYRLHQDNFTLSVAYLCTTRFLRCIDFHDAMDDHGPPGDLLDVTHCNTVIDHPIIDHCIVRNVLGHVYQVHVTGRRSNIGAEPRCKHMAFLYKGKPGRTNVYVDLSGTKPDACMKTNSGRQWRPANPSRGATPGNPGRSPDGARDPVPAMHRAIPPTPIMKRRPAPGVI
jgi:hypothetical protein